MNTDSMLDRLDELTSLEAGWLNGEGKVVDQSRIWLLRTALLSMVAQNCPVPSLFPTVEGHIQAEWENGNWAISATVDMDTFTTLYFASNSETGEVKLKTLDLSLGSSISTLADIVINPSNVVSEGL